MIGIYEFHKMKEFLDLLKYYNCSRGFFSLPVVLYFWKAHKYLKPSIAESVTLREVK
jgi:hypothetical protein